MGGVRSRRGEFGERHRNGVRCVRTQRGRGRVSYRPWQMHILHQHEQRCLVGQMSSAPKSAFPLGVAWGVGLDIGTPVGDPTSPPTPRTLLGVGLVKLCRLLPAGVCVWRCQKANTVRVHGMISRSTGGRESVVQEHVSPPTIASCCFFCACSSCLISCLISAFTPKADRKSSVNLFRQMGGRPTMSGREDMEQQRGRAGA